MLEKYFKENDWNDFTGFYKEKEYHYESLESFEKFKKKLNNDSIIALIIWELIGSNFANNWIKTPNDALDKLKPIDCINDTNLVKRLKVLLMRLPC